VIVDAPCYADEYNIEKQMHATCLNWMRTEVEDLLFKEYGFFFHFFK